MSEIETTEIRVNGESVRVWRKGSGPLIGFFAGLGGLPQWIPFLDVLAQSRTVIVPSLPGFPGGGHLHEALDEQLDWAVCVRDIFTGAGLEGADLIGSSVGGALAAELAALWPESVRRLALIAPFGLFDVNEPTANPWAQRPGTVGGLMCADSALWTAIRDAQIDADPVEGRIGHMRADTAAARLLWPLGNTKIAKRLSRIHAPTLVLRGAQDRVMPASYAQRFAAFIQAETRVVTIADAAHLAELDQPDAVAYAILEWCA